MLALCLQPLAKTRGFSCSLLWGLCSLLRISGKREAHKSSKRTDLEYERQRTVEDEVQFLLTLSRGCEEDPVADGLLDPVDETVCLPLDRQVLLGVHCTDGRLPAQDADGAGGLAADGHRLAKAHHHPGGLEDEGAALTRHWDTKQRQQHNQQTKQIRQRNK